MDNYKLEGIFDNFFIFKKFFYQTVEDDFNVELFYKTLGDVLSARLNPFL
jgi:hypothetical protein